MPQGSPFDLGEATYVFIDNAALAEARTAELPALGAPFGLILRAQREARMISARRVGDEDAETGVVRHLSQTDLVVIL